MTTNRPWVRKNPADTFAQNVERTPTCWLWRGRHTADGYGVDRGWR